MNNNFYYKGKFFEDENDFWDYVNRWPETILSEESLNEMLELFKKDVLGNLQHGLEIKNGHMNSLIEKTFFESMKLRTNLREKKD